MWPDWSVFYDGHWKIATARHLWSAFSFWCHWCVMRWFLIIANFMAPQAVLILLGVPLPILSSRCVFEQLSAPDLTSYSLSLSVLLCGYFRFFQKTDFLCLLQDMRPQLQSLHIWSCLYLLPIQIQEFLIVSVLFCLQWFLILVLMTPTILHVSVV